MISPTLASSSSSSSSWFWVLLEAHMFVLYMNHGSSSWKSKRDFYRPSFTLSLFLILYPYDRYRYTSVVSSLVDLVFSFQAVAIWSIWPLKFKILTFPDNFSLCSNFKLSKLETAYYVNCQNIIIIVYCACWRHLNHISK